MSVNSSRKSSVQDKSATDRHGARGFRIRSGKKRKKDLPFMLSVARCQRRTEVAIRSPEVKSMSETKHPGEVYLKESTGGNWPSGRLPGIFGKQSHEKFGFRSSGGTAFQQKGFTSFCHIRILALRWPGYVGEIDISIRSDRYDLKCHYNRNDHRGGKI